MTNSKPTSFKPFSFFSDHVYRQKRNLVLSSSASLALLFFDGKLLLDKISFIEIPDIEHSTPLLLFLATSYFLVTFLISSLEEILRWSRDNFKTKERVTQGMDSLIPIDLYTRTIESNINSLIEVLNKIDHDNAGYAEDLKDQLQSISIYFKHFAVSQRYRFFFDFWFPILIGSSALIYSAVAIAK